MFSNDFTILQKTVLRKSKSGKKNLKGNGAMNNFGKAIVKLRIPILILAFVLLIPSVIGYVNTKVNYDMLTYLPDDIDTMKGQEILKDEFGTGAFSMFIVEGMEPKDVAALKGEIEEVDHVKNVLWYDSVLSLSVPMDMLPDEIYDVFNSGDATMMFILYDETTSEDGTIAACEQIRKIANKQCFLSGMTPVLIDTRDLSEREAPIYVIMAVILSCIVLSIAMDSFLVPFVMLASIGMAIVYNMGSNIMLGEISYVTKALAAVLQLGVTMDYSIFLWHSYEDHLEKGEERHSAMATAINETLSSVVGSSVTTIAGFIALCFMTFTLGLDLGIVMAKGVLLGVISCVTILPSMVMVLHKPLMKTKHRSILPEFRKLGSFVTNHYKIFLIIFVIVLFPALYGYNNVPVYYNLDRTLPRDLDSIVANTKLEEDFQTGATDMLLVDAKVPSKEIRSMAREMEKVDGVKYVLGLNTIKGGSIPDDFIQDELTDNLINDNWQILIIGSEYQTATDEVNNQCDELQKIAKSYDDSSMLIGEAPCTKDLITTTDTDFQRVSAVSIGVIFVIILLVFRSLSLPFILVAVIEFGIFINMGIPYYTNTQLPFIASIVIGTIQLGSTVDYAILMTTRYRRERLAGQPKKEAITIATNTSAKSIVVSALSFFAATFGVGLYSNIDMISSLCTLMARGALISMMCVLFIHPSMLMLFDKVISRTTLLPRGYRRRQKAEAKEAEKAEAAEDTKQ